MRLIEVDALKETLDKIPARSIENVDGRAYVLIRLSTVFEIIKQLPSTQTERWDTCFDCPLSHGCPVINGCTNEQAMQYAVDIPNNCPLNKTERKIGEWIYYDPNGFKCSRCGRYLEIECGDVKMNFCPHCESYNGGEHNE